MPKNTPKAPCDAVASAGPVAPTVSRKRPFLRPATTLSGRGRRFSIVVSRVNELISGKLLEGAIDGLRQHHVDLPDITFAWCPGRLRSR